MSDQLACVKTGQYPQGVLEVMLERTMGSLIVTQCPEVLGLDGSTPPNLPGLRTKKPKEPGDHACSDSARIDMPRGRQGVPTCSGALFKIARAFSL